MSGLEVVAAVSAVVSAFHGGSELLKHIKKKRRARRARDQAQQEFEENQLQDSLVTGEQQIDLRYKQDTRELGDLMRVGDVIARDRLFHIAIILQAEVIKSLQMAATHDNAILNLRLLHEASIMNRKDTFVTLDELKQRILLSRPLARQLQQGPDGLQQRHSTRSVQTIQSSTYSPIDRSSGHYVSSAVHSPSQDEGQDSKHSFAEYFRSKRKPTPSTATQPADINFSAALEHLVRSRGTEDRSVILQDIDDMISSYQGIQVNSTRDSWGSNKFNGGPARQDTLTMLNDPSPANYGHMKPHQSGSQLFGNSPSTTYTTMSHHSLDPYHEQNLYNQQYAATNPYPQLQTQHLSPSRRSEASPSSSTFSDSKSLNRNSSSSSEGSHAQNLPQSSVSSPRPLSTGISSTSSPPYLPYAHFNDDQGAYSKQCAYLGPSQAYPTPIAPLSPLAPLSPQRNYINSPPTSPRVELPANAPTALSEKRASDAAPTHVPWPGSRLDPPPQLGYSRPKPSTTSLTPSITPFSEEDIQMANHPRYQYHLLPAVGRNPPKLSNEQPDIIHKEQPAIINNEQPAKPSAVKPVAGPLTLGTAPSPVSLRHYSIAGSIASTDSSGSNSIGILPGLRMRPIRSETIESGPVGKERMMDGRPCKDNNYWGFCKGAWAVREDPKKGISLRTQPSGMYNTRQIWECTSCTFKGDTFSAPHPTKKNKTEIVVDQRIHISMAGIRYRWIFLAKSHVKKKSTDSLSDESNYGCVICSVEGNVSSVFGGVETLMNHIALCHVADMSDKTRKKVNCILGRVAGPTEPFDINVPIFSPVEELAA